jgi:hypothetical protein
VFQFEILSGRSIVEPWFLDKADPSNVAVGVGFFSALRAVIAPSVLQFPTIPAFCSAEVIRDLLH